MEGLRVAVEEAPGLYIVRVDSTGPHNRWLLACHGDLCARVLSQVDEALDRAPPGALCVVALHHHPLPLPEESLAERFATLIGWRAAAELALGSELLQRVLGRCDLLLHGHRHIPRELVRESPSGRKLRIYNAGSSSELGRVRLFTHAEGTLLSPPSWVSAYAGVHIEPAVPATWAVPPAPVLNDFVRGGTHPWPSAQ